MKNLLSLFILCSTLALQGCFFAAGAAVGAVAVAEVNDHRSLAAVLKDRDITNEAADKINANAALHNNDNHISVACFNQIVLLTGEVASAELRQQAESLVTSVPDVKHIYNQITVMRPTSTLIRTSDAWITTKIKTQMIANRDLKASAFKVVTENGTVYIMGNVTRPQADIAVDIARQVSGVQKVIKVIQYRD